MKVLKITVWLGMTIFVMVLGGFYGYLIGFTDGAEYEEKLLVKMCRHQSGFVNTEGKLYLCIGPVDSYSVPKKPVPIQPKKPEVQGGERKA